MAFFDHFKEKAKELANTGVAQSKRLAEIAKLKTANMGEEDTIKRCYIELGKAYFAECGADASGDLAVVCEKIVASKAVIEANNVRIAELNGKAGEAEDFDQSDIVVETEAIKVETVDESVVAKEEETV